MFWADRASVNETRQVMTQTSSRLPIGLNGNWGNTVIALPRGRWRNILTGDTLDGGEQPLVKLMRRFPVCLLVREELTS